MKRNLLFYGLLLYCLATAACKKYLDVVPKEVVTEKDVYSTIVTAERVWADLYNTLGSSSTNISSGTNISACTDECKNHWENVA